MNHNVLFLRIVFSEYNCPKILMDFTAETVDLARLFQVFVPEVFIHEIYSIKERYYCHLMLLLRRPSSLL